MNRTPSLEVDDDEEEDAGTPLSLAGVDEEPAVNGADGGDPNAALMDIFAEEVEVDRTLMSLNSWVEDVEAEELVDELRAIMEDLEKL